MKINIIILFFISNIMLMCNNDKPESKNKTTKKTETQKKSSRNNVTNNLKQSANYSTLFNLESDICLALNEIAEATNLPLTSISKGKQHNKLFCYFDITLPNGDLMKYNYTAMKYGENYDMKREIKNLEKDKEFKKKSFGMYTELSETGDTYIVHSQLRNEIKIMNTSYSVILLTSYGYVQDKLTKEQKSSRDEYATKIANYLLHKHKK